MDNAGSFTICAACIGCLLGIVVCLTNINFGLQTGYTSGMTASTSLIGFSVFKLWERLTDRPVLRDETVLVQTVASATGCFPATAGLLWALPALQFLTPEASHGPLNLDLAQLILWSLGISLFGLIWAMMLRRHYVDTDKLPWPGAKATAIFIRVLHGQIDNKVNRRSEEADGTRHARKVLDSSPGWWAQAKELAYSGLLAATYGVFMFFFPILQNLPVLGKLAADVWNWTVSTSPGYFGVGVVTGPETTLHMLMGTVVGWAILAPLGKNNRWAPGAVSDWEQGAPGWII